MKLLAKTFHGLEGVLAEELVQLGATHIKKGKRVVHFEGDKQLLYRANLELRTALRILKPFREFKTKHPNHLYKKIKETDWSNYLGLDKTFAIIAVTQSKYMKHSKFVALKIKDAIVDQFREQTGERPNIDTRQPDVLLQVHISRDNVCMLSLDSSGDPLFKRGYRVNVVEAPINEVLAAGMILLAAWQKDCDFIDPMCGSGTFLIEAAMMAYNIPPQLYRDYFCFKKWNDFDKVLWEDLKQEARANIKDFSHQILGFDKDFRAIKISSQNIIAAHLEGRIVLKREKFERLTAPTAKGFIMTNPPYNERMEIEDTKAFYKMIGDQLKQQFKGHQAWLISSNKKALGFIGLRPSKKMTLFNGALECRFQGYDLY